MSLFSTKTINITFIGDVLVVGLHNQREKVFPWWFWTFWHQSGAVCAVRIGVWSQTLCLSINHAHTCIVKLRLSSSLERIGMDGLQLTIYSPRLERWSKYLTGSQRDMLRPSFYSTMHQATKSMQTTQSQLDGWWKVRTYLAFRYLVLIHPSTKGGLDTSHWWTMHALWFTPYWTASIILLPRRPSPYAWLVQRHGANPLWMQAVARKGPACSVLQFQVPLWLHGLLLPAHPLSSTWFHRSVLTAWGAHQITWPSVWFLPKIPLWAQFYWAVLGCSQGPILCGPTSEDSPWNGKHCQGVPWQCSPSSNLMICSTFLSSFLHFCVSYSLLCT